MQNFTAVDTLGTLKACLALLPFIVAPGYVAGWALDLFEFRRRRPILKLILSVPLSIAICPMLSYVLARFLMPLLWVFYIGVSAAGILLLSKEAERAKLWAISKHFLSRYTWVALRSRFAMGSRRARVGCGFANRRPTLSTDHCL